MKQEQKKPGTSGTAASGLSSQPLAEMESDVDVIPELRKHPSGEYEGAGVGRKEDVGRHPHASAHHGQQMKGAETMMPGVSAGTTDTTGVTAAGGGTAGPGETTGMSGTTAHGTSGMGGATAGVGGPAGVTSVSRETGMGGTTETAGMGAAAGSTVVTRKGEEGQGKRTTA